MTNDLDGATLLITGAATGLGAAAAELAAAAGARVAVLDINEADGGETASRIGGAFWRFDVSAAEAWPDILDQVEGRLGPIDFALLNAGIMTRGLDTSLQAAAFETMTPARYRQVLGVNVDGVVFGLHALLPRMCARGGGAVTVTSSAAGLIPIPFDPIYALTKHALIGLVRSLALAYADRPVRLNAICPGGFASPLLPPEMRTPATMTTHEIAREAIDLLLRGATGETRVKLSGDGAAQSVSPPPISLR